MRTLLGMILFLANSAPLFAATAKTPTSTILLDLDAKIYAKDQNLATEPLGKFHAESKKEGELIYSMSTFADALGTQLTEASWETQGHVKRAVVEDKLLSKTYSLEVKDKKVFYRTHDLTDGTDQTSDEDARENLVVPSTVVPYIRSFAADLLNGKTVDVRMAVLDRNDSYNFEVKKIRNEKNASGESLAVLEMKPASLFVRAVVDPMYFYVNPTNFELATFEGRSALRLKDGSKYKELIARTVYHYNVNQFKPAQGALLNNGKPCDSEATLLNPMKCAIPSDVPDEATSSSSSKSP